MIFHLVIHEEVSIFYLQNCLAGLEFHALLLDKDPFNTAFYFGHYFNPHDGDLFYKLYTPLKVDLILTGEPYTFCNLLFLFALFLDISTRHPICSDLGFGYATLVFQPDVGCILWRIDLFLVYLFIVGFIFFPVNNVFSNAFFFILFFLLLWICDFERL